MMQMIHPFKKVLVPVDFSLNTEVAINKTLELMDDEGSEIHLLHVDKSTSLKKDAISDCEKKLKQWKEVIEDDHPFISVHTSVEESNSIQTSIEKKAKEIGADLIVIGQSSTHNWLPVLKTVLPMRLAKSARTAVLTVKPGALHSKTKTVVVPVAGEMSGNKMQILERLCKKMRLNIHLVSFIDEKNDLPEIAASALLQTYQWLKAKLRCHVEYAVIHCNNKAKAILQYAEKNNADILLVYPKKETQLSWWNQHISDVLPADSRMQVLAIQPTAD